MVDIFCWNIRGINDPLKRRSFRKWFLAHKAPFGSLIETRVKQENSMGILQSIFPQRNFIGNYEYAELGRIWITWEQSTSVSVIFKSNQAITCLVKLPYMKQSFIATFIYAVNCKYGRKQLWQDLIDVHKDPRTLHLPCIMLGDYNQSLNPSDDCRQNTRITGGMWDFRNCLLQTGFFDLSYRGNHLTWWNCQDENLIAKKLDRILVNDIWLQKFPVSYGHFEEPSVSDHAPACVYLGELKRPANRPFRCSNFITLHHDFLPSLSHVWQNYMVRGSAMYIFVKKLKASKKVMRDLNQTHYSQLEQRVAEAHSELTNCQESLLSNPSSCQVLLEREAHRKWHDLALAEERFLKQKSRVKWLKEGDLNTSYFHRMMVNRRATNQIHYLIDGTGTKLDTAESIEEHCVDYFTNLLGGDTTPLQVQEIQRIGTLTKFKCSPEVKSLLTAPFPSADIKAAAFALPNNKSPGPDGFTCEFLRRAWSVVGDEFIEAVHEFFRSGQLLKQINATSITLIPKKQGAEKLTDFRPISCCNAIYKVIFKLLANRLQQVLPLYITNSQSAFVKGRLLVENVLLASELVQGFNRKHTTSRGLLKVDLRKAFDTVRWDFIIASLAAADFPPMFVNWVNQCITTTSFSIMINGSLCGHFKGTRGLRQGDPLSPSLFVIAMELFGNLLATEFSSGSIHHHPLAKDPSITHLAFADDVMVFFDGTAHSLHGICSALEQFESLSGLVMNKEKTSLFTAGLSPTELRTISSLGFQRGTLPVRYLGLPLMHRKLRISEYSPLIDAITSKFSSWTVRMLSFSGRLQLLQSVIYSYINFWFSSFSLPKGCLKKIERLCNKFLWSGSLSSTGKTKIAWKTVCLPKEEGGLGLRCLTTWNKTLTLRIIWLLFSSKDSLWVAWNKKHRLSRTSFWVADAKLHTSWIWKSLLSLRPLAKRFLTCSIGDGTAASYWHDSWLESGSPMDVTGSSGPQLMGIPSSAVVADGCSSAQWIMPSVRSRQPNLQSLRAILEHTSLPSQEKGRDVFLWKTKSATQATFSTKHTWEDVRPSSVTVPWWRLVWFKGHIPKHAFNFWVANHDRLPTKCRLFQWNIATDPACLTCSFCPETRDHLLLFCDYSSEIWNSVQHRFGESSFTFTTWSHLLTWMDIGQSKAEKFLKKFAAQATIYAIWRERNLRYHTATSRSAHEVFKEIDRTIKDVALAKRDRKNLATLLPLWFKFE